jgi:hypothetical protein
VAAAEPLSRSDIADVSDQHAVPFSFALDTDELPWADDLQPHAGDVGGSPASAQRVERPRALDVAERRGEDGAKLSEWGGRNFGGRQGLRERRCAVPASQSP